MKLPPFPPHQKAKVLRPAILSIRFTGEDTPDSAYQKSAMLYRTVLGTEPKVGRTDNYQYYAFQVGSNAEPKKRDIELRLELRATDDTPLKNRTVIYWEIWPAKNPDATKQIKEDLSKLGYTRVLEDASLAAEGSFVVGDSSNYFFGGSPNVNFPPHFVEEREGFFATASPIAGLLLGLAVGPLVLGALGLLRGSRR
ncbi:hypothetical protein E4631_20660 [Hymenobacter sp. UV11]|uniref:hypothetical protein n=1 Tax=Hymenobacter sp. UV11 TaxID=1849735 RepID=UPI00105C4FBA|nr:hypothetical protein [Hymenobacter sp. UV11]TDN40048.1 hypothetical protein A8B98_15740 [Hymenobacter sp. UV11]TFZ64038.1 hypothetical protein E4631_20660 [Hymenobacter sp. UV11]